MDARIRKETVSSLVYESTDGAGDFVSVTQIDDQVYFMCSGAVVGLSSNQAYKLSSKMFKLGLRAHAWNPPIKKKLKRITGVGFSITVPHIFR